MKSAILLTGLAAIASFSVAEELDADDVPSSCKTICQPIVDLSSTCDIDPKENKTMDKRGRFLLMARSKAEEAIEANCICTNKSFDVAAVMALCASCMGQNSEDTEDIQKMMKQCDFASTSYVQAATSVVSGIQVEATKPASTDAPQSTATSSTVSATETANSNSGKIVVSIMAVTWANLMFAFLL
ncbi:mrna 3 -end-processing yth1 [Fusarium longipes]|uniref:Mrna 3-end-processing yth1 n=1 Tax=Fusarium longipes TaxID=694270 RepID=A0A395SAX2_9HYPO|nr:mrna 3 -end-processing yth1 [Fusarium longipes]